MKTIRGFVNLPHLLLAGFIFAGCYTQIESVGNEGSDRRNGERDDYAYSDSTNNQDSGGTAVDNYFNDDDYRSMRYRMSFHYYYPSRHLWTTSIWFDPWYDDFYAYPWDPWYRPGLWYPTIAYPYPYWYPGWGYYPHYGPMYGYGNWRGHNYPLYGSTIEPGRRRTTGSRRGDDAGLRVRGGAVAPATNPADGAAPGSQGGLRTRDIPGSVAPATTDADRSSRRRTRDQVPWWERARNSNQDTPSRSRAVERSRAGDDSQPVVSRPRKTDNASSPATRKKVEQKTRKQDEQPSARQRDRRPQTQQAGDRARPKSESSYKPATRQETPRYSSPPRESGRSRSSGTGGSSTGTSKGSGERGRREK